MPKSSPTRRACVKQTRPFRCLQAQSRRRGAERVFKSARSGRDGVQKTAFRLPPRVQGNRIRDFETQNYDVFAAVQGKCDAYLRQNST